MFKEPGQAIRQPGGDPALPAQTAKERASSEKRRNGRIHNARANKQKHVVRGEIPSAASGTSGQHLWEERLLGLNLPHVQIRSAGNSSLARPPPPPDSRQRNAEPPRTPPSPPSPFSSEGEPLGASARVSARIGDGYDSWVTPLLSLSEATPSGPRLSFTRKGVRFVSRKATARPERASEIRLDRNLNSAGARSQFAPSRDTSLMT